MKIIKIQEELPATKPETEVKPIIYQEYIKSEEWRRLRKRWIDKFGMSCVCGLKGLDLHHHTYKRLGKELLTDLVLLCRECHEFVHTRKGKHTTDRNSLKKSFRILLIKYGRTSGKFKKPKVKNSQQISHNYLKKKYGQRSKKQIEREAKQRRLKRARAAWQASQTRTLN